ncbi:MAG TPA: hypothetical protein VJC18_10530, partial [bacterium]|nr:hypothetical protein [bacterium]
FTNTLAFEYCELGLHLWYMNDRSTTVKRKNDPRNRRTATTQSPVEPHRARTVHCGEHAQRHV